MDEKIYMTGYGFIYQVAHDSYCCQYFPHSRPFPNQRKGGAFVGMTGSLSADENSTAAECPRKCRPNVTSDWRYC